MFVVAPLPAGARSTGPVDFYRRAEQFPEGSNFHRCRMRVPHPWRPGELVWVADNETWFQACKPDNELDCDWILASNGPLQAKRRGSPRGERQPDGTWRAISLRGDWDAVAFTVMVIGLRVKFSDPALRAKLAATGRRLLREASQRDARWGTGPDGTGANLLGQALMLVREEQRLGALPTKPAA